MDWTDTLVTHFSPISNEQKRTVPLHDCLCVHVYTTTRTQVDLGRPCRPPLRLLRLGRRKYNLHTRSKVRCRIKYYNYAARRTPEAPDVRTRSLSLNTVVHFKLNHAVNSRLRSPHVAINR